MIRRRTARTPCSCGGAEVFGRFAAPPKKRWHGPHETWAYLLRLCLMDASWLRNSSVRKAERDRPVTNARVEAPPWVQNCLGHEVGSTYLSFVANEELLLFADTRRGLTCRGRISGSRAPEGTSRRPRKPRNPGQRTRRHRPADRSC